jgi:isoaspartyl peptidase/L-asparaginase-like protein (Ntn-hydrolase superfamily)
MRACLCFLVVEYMRSGDSVGEACRKGVQRLLKLRPLHSFAPGASAAVTCSGGITPGKQDGESVQHPTLVVGIVAMDKHGNVRTKPVCLWNTPFCMRCVWRTIAVDSHTLVRNE